MNCLYSVKRSSAFHKSAFIYDSLRLSNEADIVACMSLRKGNGIGCSVLYLKLSFAPYRFGLAQKSAEIYL